MTGACLLTDAETKFLIAQVVAGRCSSILLENE